MKLKLCAWKCGRKTDRRCGICLECCNARDEMNKRIDAGLEAYVPPDKRPGHRFYKPQGVKPRADMQRDALTQARMAKSLKQTLNQGPNGVDEPYRQGDAQPAIFRTASTVQPFITDARSY